jgi:RNA polymerase sigma factor (sigma-70 family)
MTKPCVGAPNKDTSAAPVNPIVLKKVQVPGGFPNEAGPVPAKCRRITSEETTQATLWLIAAAAGDRDAFNSLVRRHHGLMVWFCRKYTRIFHDAQDAAQNAWVSLWTGAARLVEAMGDADAFDLMDGAARIHSNRINSQRRALKRGGGNQDRYHDDMVREIFGIHVHKHGGNEIYLQELPEADVSFRRMGMVHRLVTQLPPGCAWKLDQYFFQQKPLDVIAKERGASVVTVKRGLHTAIQVLKHLCRKEESCTA